MTNNQRKTALKIFESVVNAKPALERVVKKVEDDGFSLDWDQLIKYDNSLMVFMSEVSGQLNELVKEVFEND